MSGPATTDQLQSAPGAGLSQTPLGSAAQVENAVEFDGVVAYSGKQLRRVRELLARFSATRRLARFYPGGHPAVDDAMGGLFAVIAAYHQEGADVQVSFHENEIIFGEQVLTEESVIFDQLIREMTSAGIGTLTFRVGLTLDELSRAVPLLSADGLAVDRAGGLEALRAACNLPHIFAGEVLVVNDQADGESVERSAAAAYDDAVSLVREVGRLMQANRTISATQVKGVARGLVDCVLTNQPEAMRLSGLKKHDEYTYYHSANVAILSVALGSRVTSDYRFLTSLGIGSLLHDIGKLAVDASILNKTGALSPEEWVLLRGHPLQGAQTAALIPGIDRSAIVAIAEHHMRYDLTGYPLRSPARPQHLSSRIVAIADAYDAMTSRRSYSAARMQDEAMALIAKLAGTALDPPLVRLFVRLMGIYPPRSVVRMTSGEVGIVLVVNNDDPSLPSVRVISAPSGAIIEPRDVDLAVTEGMRISGCLDPSTLNVEVEDYL
jgi:HD-GYP domain-containing protein (c-di-GMP phosphodiesterase class II)